MDYHMHLHYNPYGNPYWDIKIVKQDYIYALPCDFMYYQMVSHGIALKHILGWKSINVYFHLSLWISIWISKQMHMVIHNFGW